MDKQAVPVISTEVPISAKYILCRRIDGVNEVVLAGPKAPSAIGIVDFESFAKDHDLHPLVLAQFLKVSYEDIEKLVKHGGWIEPHAKENLLLLINKTCARSRKEICQFLMLQDGNAGARNVPIKGLESKT